MTIFENRGGGAAPTDLDGLFWVYRNPDGSMRAEFGPLTAPRELALRWKLRERENGIALAMLLLAGMREVGFPEMPEIPEMKIVAPFGGTNIVDIYVSAKNTHAIAEPLMLIVKKLADGTADEMSVLMGESSTPAQKRKAVQTLLRRFKNALEAIMGKSHRKPHGGAVWIRCEGGDNAIREMLLGWVVLERARQMVEASGSLPEKRALRKFVEERHADARNLSASEWAAAFKESGLSSLPRAVHW